MHSSTGVLRRPRTRQCDAGHSHTCTSHSHGTCCIASASPLRGIQRRGLGTKVEQQPHGLRLPIQARVMQRRVAAFIASHGIRPRVEELPCNPAAAHRDALARRGEARAHSAAAHAQVPTQQLHLPPPCEAPFVQMRPVAREGAESRERAAACRLSNFLKTRGLGPRQRADSSILLTAALTGAPCFSAIVTSSSSSYLRPCPLGRG